MNKLKILRAFPKLLICSCVPIYLFFLLSVKCYIMEDNTEQSNESLNSSLPRAIPGIVIYRKFENFHSDVEYLLLQSEFGTWQWSFTKGNFELDFNSTERIALRVLYDQTGLRRVDINIVPKFRQFSTYLLMNGVQKFTVYYLAKMKSGREIKLSGYFRDFRWLPYEEAYELLRHNDKRGVLKELIPGFIIYRRIRDFVFGDWVEYLLIQASYAYHHWTFPIAHFPVSSIYHLKRTGVYVLRRQTGIKKTDIYFFNETLIRFSTFRLPNGVCRTIGYRFVELINSSMNLNLSQRYQNFTWAPFEEARKMILHKDKLAQLTFCNDLLKKMGIINETVALPGLIVYRKSPRIVGAAEFLILKASYGMQQWTPLIGTFLVSVRFAHRMGIRLLHEHTTLENQDMYVVPDFLEFTNYTLFSGQEKIISYHLAELINPEAKINLSSKYTIYHWTPLRGILPLLHKQDLIHIYTVSDQFLQNNRLLR